MLKSFIIAFSTYSKIPMPRVTWDEKSMKYSMCWFPAVGFVIGMVLLAGYRIGLWLRLPSLLWGVAAAAIPIFVTGGIHMDGFMDTVDAKSSYRSPKERLEILKDPHSGAFAILYCFLYLIAAVAMFSTLDATGLFYVAAGYIYSRILSGLSVVTLKKAKKYGMFSDTAKDSAKSVRWILCGQLLCFIVLIIIVSVFGNQFLPFGGRFDFQIRYGIGLILVGLLAFISYRRMAYKWFGGITGDLAGYFLQMCELGILIVITLL